MKVFTGLLTLISDGGKLFQVASFFKAKTKVVNLLPYGFFCHPPKESKVVIIPDFVGSHYGIAYKNSLRQSLGESGVYVGNELKGSIIKFDKDGNINIVCNGNKTVTVTGNCTINVTGNASITATNINATATTSASITAPVSTITSTTSCTISSGGVGNIIVSPTGTVIDGKNFLTHLHSGVTAGINNTGGVV